MQIVSAEVLAKAQAPQLRRVRQDAWSGIV
jgi:hypothetical protein